MAYIFTVDDFKRQHDGSGPAIDVGNRGNARSVKVYGDGAFTLADSLGVERAFAPYEDDVDRLELLMARETAFQELLEKYKRRFLEYFHPQIESYDDPRLDWARAPRQEHPIFGVLPEWPDGMTEDEYWNRRVLNPLHLESQERMRRLREQYEKLPRVVAKRQAEQRAREEDLRQRQERTLLADRVRGFQFTQLTD